MSQIRKKLTKLAELTMKIKMAIKENPGITVPGIADKIDCDDTILIREIVETLDCIGYISFVNNKCYSNKRKNS